MIEFCVVCYNYQKRFLAQLSSIAEQIDPPDMTINVVYVRGNGNPDVETIADYYTKNHGLKFKLLPFNSREEIKFRGLTRNKQIQETTQDWIYFADCDLVFTKNYFRKLADQLDDSMNKVVTGLFLIRTFADEVGKFVENIDMFTPDIYKKASELKVCRRKRIKIASGGMQIIKRSVLFEKTGGIYVKRNRDHELGYIGTQSDIQFRRSIDGGYKKSIRIKLPWQIHLEHYRSFEEQFDFEAQK